MLFKNISWQTGDDEIHCLVEGDRRRRYNRLIQAPQSFDQSNARPSTVAGSSLHILPNNNCLKVLKCSYANVDF